MKKAAQKAGQRRLSGIAWFFVAPQASYSKYDIARIFEWTLPETESQIRMACIDGELHPFREHVINRFAREEVISFVVHYHPANPAEMLAEILMSGYRDSCMPSEILYRIAEAGDAGRLKDVFSLLRVPRFDDEPAVGSIPNPKYPPPHTPRVGSARPDLSNELPHLRTRIRRGSAPKRPRRS